MVYHITRNINQEWIIREQGSDEVLLRSRFRDVLERAGKTLVTQYNDRVFVHHSDGTIDYEMDKTKTNIEQPVPT